VELVKKIREVHKASKRTYGSPRVTKELRELSDFKAVGENRVTRLMREAGIRARHRRKYKKPTSTTKEQEIAPNLLNRCFSISAPNRVWVADITQFTTAVGWVYLAAIMDLYSRLIVGWALAHHERDDLTLEALRMALWQRRPEAGLIHHSDQGGQYGSWDYQNVLKRNGIVPSMNRAGNCYDNAAMESFFSSLKREWIIGKNYSSREEAKRDIFEYIEVFYNRHRRHSTLGYLSPMAFEQRQKVH
jgi:transposase InsO family protein